MENLHLILLHAGHSTHYADWNWKNTSSPFTRIYYVNEGHARIRFRHFVQDLRPQHMYLIPPFTLHDCECSEYFSHFYVHVYENQKGKSSLLEDFIFPTEIAAGTLELQLLERLLEIQPDRELKQYDPKVYDNPSNLMQSIAEETQQRDYVVLETNGILSQLVSRFFRYAVPKTETKDERIGRTLKYIRKHIDSPIKIGELAKLCNLSDDHFIRLFKKELNCTPIQYINRKKIEKAQLMLVIENVPIKDIAYYLSFEHISYFNKLFKSITGNTPLEYLSQIKNK